MTLTDWRCVVKVRTLDVSRIFAGITHATEGGAGGLKLRLDEKVKVSPETLLMLDVMKDECGADLSAQRIIDEEHIHRPLRAPVTAPTYDPDDVLGVFFRLPPPPMPLTCEFDLGMCTKSNSCGKFLSIIFWMMGYSLQTAFTLEVSKWPGWDNRKRCVSDPGIFDAANDLWDTIFNDVAEAA